jgi:hypothetical protein
MLQFGKKFLLRKETFLDKELNSGINLDGIGKENSLKGTISDGSSFVTMDNHRAS